MGKTFFLILCGRRLKIILETAKFDFAYCTIFTRAGPALPTIRLP